MASLLCFFGLMILAITAAYRDHRLLRLRTPGTNQHIIQTAIVDSRDPMSYDGMGCPALGVVLDEPDGIQALAYVDSGAFRSLIHRNMVELLDLEHRLRPLHRGTVDNWQNPDLYIPNMHDAETANRSLATCRVRRNFIVVDRFTSSSALKILIGTDFLEQQEAVLSYHKGARQVLDSPWCGRRGVKLFTGEESEYGSSMSLGDRASGKLTMLCWRWLAVAVGVAAGYRNWRDICILPARRLVYPWLCTTWIEHISNSSVSYSATTPFRTLPSQHPYPFL